MKQVKDMVRETHPIVCGPDHVNCRNRASVMAQTQHELATALLEAVFTAEARLHDAGIQKDPVKVREAVNQIHASVRAYHSQLVSMTNGALAFAEAAFNAAVSAAQLPDLAFSDPERYQREQVEVMKAKADEFVNGLDELFGAKRPAGKA